MKTIFLAALVVIVAVGCQTQGVVPDQDPGTPAGRLGNLVRFGNEAELKVYLEKTGKETVGISDAAGEAPSAEPVPIGDTGSANNEEITNNQEVGVDEGGIVKNYKDLLIVLRQGHLYTVRVGGETGLERVDDVPVAAEGLDTDVWYDEILVDDSKVIVIGYRYSVLPAEGTWYKKSATEVNLFTLSEEGTLTRGETYFIEFGDYYSWTNYASRMLGGKLVLYMPYYASFLWEQGADVRFPGLYQYENGTLSAKGKLFTASDVVRPVEETSWPTFHVMAVCSLDKGLDCHSDVVLGPWSRTYYVSKDAAYLFLSQSYGYYWVEGVVPALTEAKKRTNLLYRFDLDGTSSGAVGIEGNPFDQFSLSESEGLMDVFITAYHTDGNASRSYQADQALVRVPVSDFDGGGTDLLADRYLLMPDHDVYNVRFHNNHLVYAGTSHVGVVDLTSGSIVTLINPFYVTRIEPAGERAIIFGSDNWGWGDSLSMASVSLGLEGTTPTLGPTHTIPLVQGEWRSHGYAYHESNTTDEFGLATLEIREKDHTENDYWDWYEYIPSVSFFSLSADGSVSDVGKMEESSALKLGNVCTTSCIDWYGNSRPIFLDDHVIGLMGDQMGMDGLSLNFVSGEIGSPM